MSRIRFTSKAYPNVRVHFGLDCAGTQNAGYFVQLWLSDGDEPHLELDTRPGFTPRTASRGVILETLREHGCDQVYLSRIAMDLDPAG